MESACRKEIVQLHQFFEDWYHGRVENSVVAFSRMAEVMAEPFTIIFPSGSQHRREDTLRMVREGYGRWRGSGNRIWIENVALCWQEGSVCLLTYEEWQETDGEMTARFSSVLFRAQSGTPNGLIWLHVHETWLPLIADV